jgi:hypothetical protein
MSKRCSAKNRNGRRCGAWSSAGEDKCALHLNLLKGSHKNIALVDLDGFAPSAAKIKKSDVQGWSAE